MKKQRNIGLDIARCAAMAMVWICHSGYFSVGISYHFLSFAGVLCVDIFFVLSGLLVGKSLILAVTDRSPGPALKRFYINRLVRTIPIYYLMLLVTTAVYGKPVSLSYFVFLHNYQADLTGFLPQAWSLSVEAWFYFLVPPIFWMLVRLFSRKQSGQAAVFQAIGLLYLIPLALRVFTVFLINPEWDAGIRKMPHLRLDAVLLGMFLSALKLYAGDLYRKLAKSNWSLLLSVGGILGLYVCYCRDLDCFENSRFWKIFLFTLLPALCGLLILYLENFRPLEALRGTFPEKLICGVSTVGYGIYLTHMLIFERLSRFFVDAGFAMSWLGFLLAIAAAIACGALLYVVVEVPANKLRDKILAAQAENPHHLSV